MLLPYLTSVCIIAQFFVMYIVLCMCLFGCMCLVGDVYKTRELTPFLECVDQSPVVRSVLPKLLLQYRYQWLSKQSHTSQYSIMLND